MSDLIHLSNRELIDAVGEAAEWADQESAHELGDEALVIAILRCADDEFSMNEAVELVGEYSKLNRKFG